MKAAASLTLGSCATLAEGRCPQFFPGSAGRALRLGGLLVRAVPRRQERAPSAFILSPVGYVGFLGTAV